ncbi:MAG: hypothetical protein IJG55_00930, partial [Synergistaceae bacterium]|nr:hypothetical protein [Synergistaceae bacterium]
MKRKLSALLISAFVLSFAGAAFAGVGITFSKTVPTKDGGEITISAGVDDFISSHRRHYRPGPPPP